MKETVKIVGNKIVLWLNDGTNIEKINFGVLERDTIVCPRNSNKHLYKIHNSYGFNRKVIQEILFSFIEVNLGGGNILTTTKDYLLENGFEILYKGEKQIHLQVPEFGMEKALKWEAAKKQFPESYKNFRFLAELAVSSNNNNPKHIQ